MTMPITSRSGGIAITYYYFDDAGNHDRSAPVHHRRQSLQKDEPGTARSRRRRTSRSGSSPAPSTSIRPTTFSRNIRSTIWPPTCRSTAIPGTIWLTKQKRVDRDYALFGEASFDVTPQITLTGGGRYYKFDNTVFGFAGFGRNPAFIQERRTTIRSLPMPRAAPDRRRAVLHDEWRSLRDSQLQRNGHDAVRSTASAGTPCINVGRFEDGKIEAEAEQGPRLHLSLQRATGSRATA